MNLSEQPPQPVSPSQPAPAEPPPPPRRHPLEVWAEEARDVLRQQSDLNGVALVDLWVAVAKTKPIKGWEDGQEMTKTEVEEGIQAAKNHVPGKPPEPPKQRKPAGPTVHPSVALGSGKGAR